ncbi:MAG: hypothetical protein ABIN67_04650 [Ferruginibacter sp.]
MNNTFSVPRFALLLKKTLLERPMQLVGLSVLALAVVFFSYVLVKSLVGFEEAQVISYVLGLVGGGCFLASFVFGYFSSNAMGSSFLTLPASHFEKWLCAVLITGVFYVLIFLLFFHSIDNLFVEIYHKELDPNGAFYKQLYEQVQPFPYDGFVAKKAATMFVNFAGAMLVGCLYFNKVSFIKVALLIATFWFGSYLINLAIAKVMIKNVENAMPYFLVWIQVHTSEGRIELPAKIMDVVRILIQYIIPSMLWLLAFLRLREKEF